ncbi:terminase small subunit [Xanthomonas phage Xoo-sp13]|nr:terminase small subunit [Xanthomonas phage Xoo-sp13]
MTDIITEYVKCETDHQYFINTYMGDGVRPLYDHQVELLNRIDSSQLLLVNAYRESGTSYASVAYILWELLFKPRHLTLAVTSKLSQLGELRTTLLNAIDTLPDFLKPKIVVSNNRCIKFDNDAIIVLDINSINTGRGRSANTVFLLDVNGFTKIPLDAVSASTRASSGKVILVATGKLTSVCKNVWDSYSDEHKITIRWPDVSTDTEYKDNIIKKVGQNVWDEDFELVSSK